MQGDLLRPWLMTMVELAHDGRTLVPAPTSSSRLPCRTSRVRVPSRDVSVYVVGDDSAFVRLPTFIRPRLIGILAP